MGKSKRRSKARKAEVSIMPSASATNEQHHHDPDDIFHLPQISRHLPSTLGHTFTCMFLALDLAFNKDDHKEIQVHMNYKYNVLKKYLELKPDRPERHAIRNLLGVLAARLGRYEDAAEFFVCILTEDQTNINAIANATWLCDHLTRGEFGSSGDVKDRLRGELAETDGIWNATKSDRQWRDIAARCTAEQVFSSTFQPWDNEQDVDHYCKAHKLYEHALGMLGNGDANGLEREDYEFQDAIACLAIAKKLLFKDQLDLSWDYFQLSLPRFHGVAQSCANLHMRSESWRKMAETIKLLDWKDENRTRDILHDLNSGRLTWPLCIEKALAVDSDDQSIGIDCSHYNRSAFITRGKLSLEMYCDKQAKNYRRISEPNSPDLAWLKKAQADFEHALSLNETAKVYSCLAQVWEILDKDVRGFTLDLGRKTCMAKALGCHEKAINCQNGGTPEVVRARGICLFEAGKYDAAIASFQQVIEFQSDMNNPRDYVFLMRIYLTVIEVARSGQEKQNRLGELTSVARQAVGNLQDGELRHVEADLWKASREAMRVFMRYCEDSHHDDILQKFSSGYRSARNIPGDKMTASSLQQSTLRSYTSNPEEILTITLTNNVNVISRTHLTVLYASTIDVCKIEECRGQGWTVVQARVSSLVSSSSPSKILETTIHDLHDVLAETDVQ